MFCCDSVPTCTSAELRDQQYGGVITTSCTNVPLFGLAHKQGLSRITNRNAIVLQRRNFFWYASNHEKRSTEINTPYLHVNLHVHTSHQD